MGTRLYVDGLLVAVGGPPMLGNSNVPMQIGGNPELGDRNWSGLIDEVAVWGRALSTGEVRQLWNAGQGAKVGELVLGNDTDGDGMSDEYEVAHGLDPNLDDSALDPDADNLTNLEEHDAGSDPSKADSDDDGLRDDAELAAGTNPLTPDSDGDGITDGDEIEGTLNAFLKNVRRDPFDPMVDPPGDPTDPLDSDSDNDFWTDSQEIGFGSDPNNDADFPLVTQITSLGTGSNALLGGDLTDPENDGVDGQMTNWNWVSISSSSEPTWGGEGAFNIFDNKVGAGQDKWCCNAPPQMITVEFAEAYSLTHFTLSSGNDVPNRDPTLWSIQGSNDGLVWDVPLSRPGIPSGTRRKPLDATAGGTAFSTPEAHAALQVFSVRLPGHSRRNPEAGTITRSMNSSSLV